MAATAAVAVPAPRPSVDGSIGDAAVLPELWVPEAEQWLSTTSGRVAPDGYSWLQAVHWVAGSGLYQPRRHRSTGLRSFNATTVYVAQLLAELSPCFPGLGYLQRRTGLSERMVEYHLAALRETGLLAYIVKGTRRRGEPAQASEFARVIPLEFDEALGIRTRQHDQDAPAYTRVMVGIADAGRELMGKLAKKAARKVRRSRSKTSSRTSTKASVKNPSGSSVTAVSGGTRCTPMGGSSSTGSSAGGTSFPPESELASGGSKSSTAKKSKAKAGGRREMNKVGRRFQLARELTQELDWLRGCSVPRIAWVARHVADAGWTVTDIRGWLHLRGEAARVRRGSGLLAVLLAGAEKVLDSPEKRADAVARWRGGQEAARRHRIQQVRARGERFDGDWEAPTSRSVQRKVEEAFTRLREAASGGRHQDHDAGAAQQSGAQDPSEQELQELRATARGELMKGETTLITSVVNGLGREGAERIFGAGLVRRALQLASGARSSLMTIGRQ
ncbi:transcriptional regulator [Streptomyces sp. NPDC127197]|uniref:transcriptional regulator n=1 Tax=Streptomyces sp. NPDC127197 TaxID=3345388 RepID=UPI00362C8728